jgi:hypothetical protein
MAKQTVTSAGELVRRTDAACLIPGYEIVRKIASGGSGVVYEVRAPGGIAKAAKIVFLDDDNPLTEREIEGVRLIRSIRHPYLVSIDRVDVDRRSLILIMELADCSLREMQTEFRASGATGIPRERLIPWLVEAAEALDVLNLKYRVHHLDVKPENLFLFAEHMKVGDYGLAREAGRAVIDAETNAVTPAYAAPELFDSHVSPSSDQYSLAVVYMEMLTGSRPFQSTDLRQLALYHLTRKPDLAILPPHERPIVGRALSRDPSQRYRSCLEFMEALVEGDPIRASRIASPRADTVIARSATVRMPTGRRASDPGSLESLRAAPTFSQTKCLLTEALIDDAREAVRKIAVAARGEWYDFGDDLVAYRVRDDWGSLLVGVRMFHRDPHGSILLEAAVTRHGSPGPTPFERQASAVFDALERSLAASQDDSAARREPRMQVQIAMTVFPADGPMRNVPIPCTAVNASVRGLGAVSMIPIEPQPVRIRPARGDGEFDARVVYCKPSADGANFFVGFELAEIEAEPDWLARASVPSPTNAAGT